jgi:plasmid stabilization system protein ParE
VGKYSLSPEALEDLDTIWEYIAQDNREAADRVVESAYRACANLAAHPQLGPLKRFPNNDPPDIRFFVLTDFPSYLIFYRPMPDGLEIIRVLHSAQDIDGLVGQ